jgi:hypothetical protein
MGMKKLEKSFVKKGFKYTQVERKGNIAIYKQESAKIKDSKPNYEVIQIKSHNGYEIGGSKIAAAEVYPGSTQWGILGWTHLDLASAEKRFKKLVRELN